MNMLAKTECAPEDAETFGPMSFLVMTLLEILNIMTFNKEYASLA
jgi:hypothetical protein